MQVLCIANQKGGIGKTTTATALTSILEIKGYKTPDSNNKGEYYRTPN